MILGGSVRNSPQIARLVTRVGIRWTCRLGSLNEQTTGLFDYLGGGNEKQYRITVML